MRSNILKDEVWSKGTRLVQKVWSSLGHDYHPGHLVIMLLCAFQFHANISSGLPLDINSLLENLSTVAHVWIFWSCGPILKHFTGNVTTLLAMVSGVLTCTMLSGGSLPSEWQPIGTILASSLIGALTVVASIVSSSKLIVVGRQMARQRIRECAFCLVLLGTQPYMDLFSCVGGFMGGFLVSSLIVKSPVICRFKCTLGKLSLMRKARKLKDERKELQIIGAKIVDSDDNEEDIDDQASLILQRLSLIDIKRSFVNGCYRQQV